MDTPWTITLLGGLEARCGPRSIAAFPTKRAAALLGRLAFRAGEPLLRDELMEMLWPEVDPEKGRNRLNVELSRLRELFRELSPTPGRIIEGDQHHLFLNRELVTTDLSEFDACRTRSLRAVESDDLLGALNAAFDLYRGPLLPESEEDWVYPAREKVARQYLQVTARLANELLKSDRLDSAIEIAQTAVGKEHGRLDPCESRREDAALLLMLLLNKAGRHREVLDQFDELCGLLEQEGREPSRDAQRLAQEARQQASKVIHAATSARAPAPAGVLLVMEVEVGRRRPDDRLLAAMAEQAEEHLSATLRRFGAADLRTVDHCLYACFRRVGDAFDCALECAGSLAAATWPDGSVVPRIRAAVHQADWSGDAEAYFPVAMVNAVRYLAPAHPGQILVSEAVQSLTADLRNTGWQLSPLGLFRITEEGGAERLFQLNLRGAEIEPFPPPNAPFAFTPQIPATFGSFLGRQADIDRLIDLLAGDTELVTLTGPGGIGKTRLATEAARALSDRFCGAVWFVSLSELTSAGQIPSAITRAMGVSPDPDTEPIDGVIKALPDARCLLVLDNFEHLVDEGAATIRLLIERASDLRCLVTSRRRLELSIEQEVEVRPLAAPGETRRASSGSARDSLRSNASAQLFEDRARQSRTGFEITDKNCDAVRELCRRLDGIPLAIELAASWAKMLTPADMLTRLEKILVTHKQDVPARHRSVQAAVEGSYLLLDEELQDCFKRLSVFRGGWTLEAAAEVCEAPDILDLLMRLQDRSMVLADETVEGYRGRMLEPLRAYAAELLAASGALEAVRMGHARYYEKLAAQVGSELEGADQLPGLRKLETEYQNLQGALEAADVSGRLNIAGNLGWFWRLRGQRSEGLRWLKGALADPPGVSDEILQRARNTGGILAWAAGDFDTARAFLEPVLTTHERRGDKRGFAVVLVNLANLASSSGDYSRARADYERSLDTWRSLKEPRPLAVTLNNLGTLANDMGDSRAAGGFLEEALGITDQSDAVLRATILHNLAESAAAERDYKRTATCLSECLTLRAKMEDRDAIWNLASLLARVALATGSDEAAARLYGVCDAVEQIAQVVLGSKNLRDASAAKTLLRSRLSEPVFEREYDAGRGMDWVAIQDHLTQSIERTRSLR